jgi:hypothetical protein
MITRFAHLVRLGGRGGVRRILTHGTVARRATPAA